MKAVQHFDPFASVARMPVLGATAPVAPIDTQTVSVFVSIAGGAGKADARTGAAPTWRERLRRRYWHYELDMTHHPVVLRFTLPAKEEALAFAATVTLLWVVQDPVEVALLGIRDLKPVIWTFLDQLLRGVGRQYGIEEIAAAEAEMRLGLEKTAGDIGFGLKLPLLAVTLRLDEDTERYLSERIETGRAGHLAGDRHVLAQIRADFEQQEAEWRGMLEHAQAQHRRDLDQAQADYTREVERLTAVHEIGLKTQRLSFYRDALGGGNHDVLVLQLIEHPGDIGAVLEMIDSGQEKHYRRSREILSELLGQQMYNAADMDDLRKDIIGQLQNALTAAAPRSKTVVEEVKERTAQGVEKQGRRITQETTM